MNKKKRIKMWKIIMDNKCKDKQLQTNYHKLFKKSEDDKIKRWCGIDIMNLKSFGETATGVRIRKGLPSDYFKIAPKI